MAWNTLPEEKDSPSDVIDYKTPNGRTVTLSREALDAYGEKYIDQLAKSAGKSRLLLADEHVLAHAKAQFPSSETPIVDMYPDYMMDNEDFNKAADKQGRNRADFSDIEASSSIEGRIEQDILNNTPSAMSQPHGNSSIIVIPSASSIKDDKYKNDIISSLTGIENDKLGNIPGSSMDWAKYTLSHEVSHIAQKESEKIFDRLTTEKDLTSSIKNLMQEKWHGELAGDLSARRDFNAVSGTPPQMPQAFADIRIISGFAAGQTMTHYSQGNMDEHTTGNALQDVQEGRKPEKNPDKAQFTTAYTNTLVGSLIAAKDGNKIVNDALKDSKLTQDQKSLFENGRNVMNTSLKTDASLTASDIGASYGQFDTRMIYASTKVLLENGQFDDCPDAKKNAERFIRAAERTAPDIVDPAIVDEYRKAYQDPETQKHLQSLHQYNTPHKPYGYANEPEKPAIENKAVSAMAPAT